MKVSGQKVEVSHALWARSGCGSLGVQWGVCRRQKGLRAGKRCQGPVFIHWALGTIEGFWAVQWFDQNSVLVRKVAGCDGG